MRGSRIVFLLVAFFILCAPLKGNCANISERDAKRGVTALMAAARDGDSQTIQTLLDNKAGINMQDKNGRTALMVALTALRGPNILTLLNDHEPTPNQAIQILLDNGVDINAQDKDGLTALMMAVEHGPIQAVKKLLDNKADPLVKRNDGTTALEMARSLNNADAVRLLERYGTK